MNMKLQLLEVLLNSRPNPGIVIWVKVISPARIASKVANHVLVSGLPKTLPQYVPNIPIWQKKTLAMPFVRKME